MGTISELKHMVVERSEELSEQVVPLPDTPDPREGMNDIHFGLLPGYQVLGKNNMHSKGGRRPGTGGLRTVIRGGVYMDLDVIILDDRLPNGPDGLPAQRANDVWQDQALVGNFLK